MVAVTAAARLDGMAVNARSHDRISKLYTAQGTSKEALLAMYASSSAGENRKNLPAPTIRMSPRPGEPNSCFEPRPEVENTELYERHGPYHGTAAGRRIDDVSLD